MIFLLISCASYFENYWPDATKHPQISSISPEQVEGLLGGDTLLIQGNQLENTRTVVIGDRNATIISSSATTVEVLVPPSTAGGGAVDIVLATDNGMARSKEIFTYNGFNSPWWQNETASFVAGRLECPLEAWALTPDEEWTSLLWCGFEMGYSWANGMIGNENQSGFAADMSGFHPLSALPKEGEIYFHGEDDEAPLSLPTRYSSSLLTDSIHLLSPRNFEDDIAFIEERMAQIEAYYYWYEDVTAIYPTISYFDEDSCWMGDAELESATATQIVTNGLDQGATGILLGIAVEEDYDGEVYFTEAFTSSIRISDDANAILGNTIHSEKTGLYIDYDDYSGQFFADGVNGVVGLMDLPFQATFDVMANLNQSMNNLGQVQSMQELELIEPDLLSGLSQIDQAARFTIEWEPIENSHDPSNDPSIVIAEIRIYDFSIDNPNGWHEVSRLLRWAYADAGSIDFVPIDLLKLPITPNRVDADYNPIGLWGELTISHHQLRKVSKGDGDLVIDFVHALQTPIDVINSNLE